MSEITKVNTGAVLQNAESILSEAAAFKAAFDAMYDTIHDLNKTFTSADGKAYIAKIDGYQGDFTAMYDRLVNSAEGIRAIAEQYDATVRKNMV
jgi:uncharacterized protein YukE